MRATRPLLRFALLALLCAALLGAAPAGVPRLQLEGTLTRDAGIAAAADWGGDRLHDGIGWVVASAVRGDDPGGLKGFSRRGYTVISPAQYGSGAASGSAGVPAGELRMGSASVAPTAPIPLRHMYVLAAFDLPPDRQLLVVVRDADLYGDRVGAPPRGSSVGPDGAPVDPVDAFAPPGATVDSPGVDEGPLPADRADEVDVPPGLPAEDEVELVWYDRSWTEQFSERLKLPGGSYPDAFRLTRDRQYLLAITHPVKPSGGQYSVDGAPDPKGHGLIAVRLKDGAVSRLGFPEQEGGVAPASWWPVRMQWGTDNHLLVQAGPELRRYSVQ